MTWPLTGLLLGLVIVPILASLVDVFPAARARRGTVYPAPADGPTVDDFTVLVPIYGNITYLENVDFLRPYSSRVRLCTTTSESADFDAALDEVAAEHGFSVLRIDVVRPTKAGGHRRQVAGTIRDQLVKAATETVTSSYVVCIDADTTTDRPLDELVGALDANGLDLASTRLVPSNRDTLLGRLQGHEYRMAMRLRRIMPWLCSGACQVARSEPHKEIMRRHSLFFQGNDVEMGLLGHALGYRVGYLAFTVPTIVPGRFYPWWRQRFAWAGGEFRLWVVNFRIVRRHPWFIVYGALIVTVGAPLRWLSLEHPGLDLLTVLVIYWLLVTAVNWRHRDLALLVYPFYGFVNSMILVPLGIASYARMALGARNAGIIRTRLRSSPS